MRHVTRAHNNCTTKCDHRVVHDDHKKVGNIKRLKCKKDAPSFYYFDGRENISLCAIHAEEYRQLNLTVLNR